MPELPEVETIKEAMRKAVDGARIESVLVRQRRLRVNIPSNFEDLICGAKISRLYRMAKYAIMELDNGYSIIWHFGMSGKITIVQNTNPVPEKHDHVIINTSNGALVYNDPRRFGLVSLCESDKLKECPFLCHLGLDPFDKNLSVNYLKDKFLTKRIPIKLALLDQAIISGIGNIYASEALYVARISPLRESCSLTSVEIKELISAVRDVLKKAIDAGGSTLHDYRKPDGDIGYFQFQHTVYGKEGQKCPQCVSPQRKCKGIQKIIQGGRSTFYCPHLQK